MSNNQGLSFRLSDKPSRGQASLDEIVGIERVSNFACRALRALETDLLSIAGSVYHADRSARRSRSHDWVREMCLEISVHEDRFWSQPEVLSSLKDCLHFVTGDRWTFDFVRRRSKHQALSTGFLTQGTGSQGMSAVVSYSGGLDSYAGVRLLRRKFPHLEPYLVRAKTRGYDARVGKDFNLPAAARDPVIVDVRLPHSAAEREPTARTRTFLFLSIAGIAASLIDARQVIVCENGQGSLGPSLVPGPWENEFRATHPGFTRRLAGLLQLVCGRAIPIVHPFLDQTKADVLRQFSKPELKQALEATDSCVRYPLRHKGVRPARKCGICGGCLLRRVSLIAAGHDDLERTELYYWQDLSADKLSSPLGPTTERDKMIAFQSVQDMASLAALAERNGDAASIQRVSYEYAAARNVGPNEAIQQIRSLVQRHRQDWDSFIASLGPRSWVRILTGAKHNA